MLFTRAFATSGVCSPARATLLTGLIPSRTGVHNGLPERFTVPDYSAVEEFRNAATDPGGCRLRHRHWWASITSALTKNPSLALISG